MNLMLDRSSPGGERGAAPGGSSSLPPPWSASSPRSSASLLDGDDGELTLGNGPATSESGVTTSAPETKSTPSTTNEPPSEPASVGRTSPLEVFGAQGIELSVR